VFTDLKKIIKITIPKTGSYIKWDDNQTTDIEIELPAYYIAYLIQKQSTETAFKAVRVLGNLVAIITAIPTGGQSITLVSAISAGLAVGDLVVLYNEDAIKQTTWGKSFLNIWDKVQLADIAFAVTNVVVKGTKGLLFNFDNFGEKFAKLSKQQQEKALNAFRKAGALLQEAGQSLISRLFITRITSRAEAEALRQFIKMNVGKGAVFDFENLVEGIIKFNNKSKKLFEVALSSNGSFIKFSKPVKEAAVAGD
jgi:hypothetical protein